LTTDSIVVRYFQNQLNVATMTKLFSINNLVGLILVLVEIIIISGEKKGLVMV
jgi:hypothetical protein